MENLEEFLDIFTSECLGNENFHKVAYNQNSEYKKFWDNINENSKNELLEIQLYNKMLVSNGAHKELNNYEIKEIIEGEMFNEILSMINNGIDLRS